MSGDKSSAHFWERTGICTPYLRLRQTDNTCVFVSAAAAINHLCNREVWSEASLFQAYIDSGAGGVNFTSVMKIAAAPVESDIEWKDCWDEPGVDPISIDDAANWLQEGGIVVASLERATQADTGLKRDGLWHMFTLIAVDGDYFEVWDSNGRSGFVSKWELEDGFVYPTGNWFVVHDRHNMLLVRRKR